MHGQRRVTHRLVLVATAVAALAIAPTVVAPNAHAEICPGILGPVVVPGPCGPGLLGALVNDAVIGATAGAVGGAIDAPHATREDIAAQQSAGLPPCYTPSGQPFYTAAGEPCPAGMEHPPAAKPAPAP
ncbi:hypothetical protein [Mycolicibacter arupensis]|jgi:hypothetical protein|uniref:DUF732 domain-containing protein n=1 Tax=Mycolicibacter arupensis TaxID=342002 RepID=A0A0F5N2F7_9MYCO|nr:hypothetical protein [Mycolicibacter arupensis]KAA1428179.1 hypothetical protein F0402_19640 [Mycolicibacter arupensis]KKC01224.1 hypothetical protein WR43_00710 [Mycolicibacter arupensis]MCV7277305.1 hypothetical protein [Mycolicibacter arupensis]OQZ99785.1 hypothetical protein BST15_06905 [Mycolicibacter arupensis]TXI50143.1 MAG: hypothetical protein E6Q54_21905 [Mycolicibacter arupensis]